MHLSSIVVAFLASMAITNAMPAEAPANAPVQGAELVPRATTDNELSHNCGGRWGVVKNPQAVGNAIETINPKGVSCLEPHTCMPLGTPVCNNGVRVGWCNDAAERKCLFNPIIRDRLYYVAFQCETENNNNAAGQGFWDVGNYIVQKC